MRDAQPKTLYLKDYRPPEFLIERIELEVELGEQGTLIRSRLSVKRNSAAKGDGSAPLVLHGRNLSLQGVKLDGRVLDAKFYSVTPERLSIRAVPDSFVLETRVRIHPESNTSLEGLYKSRKMFCTQCEAEGFRKITYYLDRPDVLAEFFTTIIADRERYPVLLSNGNLVDSADLDDGRHRATWHDPFPKPCYLFALVAGDLRFIEDRFVTMSGREVSLRLFVEEKDLDKCDHAMASLKRAMAWDEQVYGREYDLDTFMIVAVDDFNMGAMENKGLNIFNTSALLAKPDITTDLDFQRVEGVVGHEYFHNWSGNRVTCRDWFQLSLKEGFTVFRDQQFSAAMGSPTVKRVEDVLLLRTLQFAEDAGPMAHPVQPGSYMEISNFYTMTVYQKGAEVVRMLYHLLGADPFRRGCDLYFSRHDGQAVTVEDFVAAMAEAGGRDLSQFMGWYRQAGTPRVNASGEYDSRAQTFSLHLSQRCPDTPETEVKQPFHIPVAMGLVGNQGDLPLWLRGRENNEEGSSTTLELTEPEQTFVFEKVAEPPVPSLFRGFSAPVRVAYSYSREQLAMLISRDSDGFNRWDATQQLATGILQELITAIGQDEPIDADDSLIESFRSLLQDEQLDPAMVALMLSLPSERILAEQSEVIRVAAIHRAREFMRRKIAMALEDELLKAYRASEVVEPYAPDAGQVARRSLRNMALDYLTLIDAGRYLHLAESQFDTATNMTDGFAALSALVNAPGKANECGISELGQQALDRFYRRWRGEPLVVNRWLSVQARCPLPGGLERVSCLLRHPAFDIKNPNKVRSLIGTFAIANAINFHDEYGAGYAFLADRIIELNDLNPQIASRLVTPLTEWKKFPDRPADLMQGQLSRIRAVPGLSGDVFEVVEKSLNHGSH